MDVIKKLIHEFLKRINLRLSFYDKSQHRYKKIIKSHEIGLIFDVGANAGQFALEVIESGFRGRIVSFEPTTNAYNMLKIASNTYENWSIHDRVALGKENTITTINVAGNDAHSSSILEMDEAHEQGAPASAYVGSEEVSLITLDSVFKKYAKNNDKVLLKIDVQGFEEQVLIGASQSLDSIYAVKIECSLVPLYKEGKTYEFYFDLLKELGFKLIDIEPGFTHTTSGNLLQFDAFFVRAE